MSCTAITTGSQFLATVLDHVDCQAQSIGTFGFGALAASGSPASWLLLALLTLFIALFGIRLMMGAVPDAGDIVGSALKIGIVLTLATSWPAWRALGYDLVMSGPSQLAASIGSASGLPGTRQELNQRLQGADDGIVSLTASGTGRLSGAIAGPQEAARGIALTDQSGFAWGRIAFLASTLAPLGLVRLASGILLALAPLMAGLLLFAGTRDLFVGWLRALLACAVAALSLTLCYAVELMILEGWLRDAILQRNANLLTPATPTELLAITLTFALINWAMLALICRMMFFSSARMPGALFVDRFRDDGFRSGFPAFSTTIQPIPHAPRLDLSRAQQISGAIAHSLRMESAGRVVLPQSADGMAGHQQEESLSRSNTPSLGSAFRRTTRRHSTAASQRDSRP
jgi:type IV secretion system protein VirB6